MIAKLIVILCIRSVLLCCRDQASNTADAAARYKVILLMLGAASQVHLSADAWLLHTGIDVMRKSANEAKSKVFVLIPTLVR